MRKKAERIDNEIEKIINEKISRISENLVKEKEVLKM
jgi:hypothetical protein